MSPTTPALPSLIALALCCAGVTRADVLLVPDQFGGIQLAIQAAQPGDTVVVSGNGEIYGENLVMRAGVSVVGVGEPMVAAIVNGVPTVSFPDPATGRETLLSGLTLVNGTAALGAGILIGQGASPTIRGNLIQYQESTWGAGIFAWPEGSPLISKNTIRDCHASQGGGGLFLLMPGAYTELVHNQIELNSAGKLGGGALLYGGSTHLAHNQLERNVSGGDGGGLWVHATELQSRANDLVDNSASSGKGGGAYLSSLLKPLFEEGVVRENEALYGGGLYLDDCTMEVEAVELLQNHADLSGGGVYVAGDQVDVGLSACDLRNNVAGLGWWSGEGGGVLVDGLLDIDVVNCVLYANSAGYGWNTGAGIRVRRAEKLLLVNNTLVENRINDFFLPGSGAALGQVADARVTNNWFVDHLNHISRDALAVPVTLRTNLYSSPDLVQLVPDPSDGIALPQFAAPGVDFHVLPGDPGVNAGSAWLPGVPSTDMDGQVRLAPKIDIGADELGGA